MHQQRIIERNHVKVIGNGRQPIVFAAGFGCDQNMWRFVAPAFAEEYQVILFDYVGAGRTDLSAYDPNRYASLSGYAQDLLDVLSALQLKDVIFVGHSVAGMIGLLASLKEPERFKKMIMIGPSPCYINDLPNYYGGFEKDALEGLFDMMDNNYIGWANFLAPVIMQNGERPELANELEESFCSTDPTIAKNFARATFLSDNRADLQKATTPTLIMQCSEDAIAPTEVGEYMQRNMPESEIVYMKATGHCPHLSHPEETISLIYDYLNEQTVYYDPSH